MRLWIDAQLSPALATWISGRFPGIEASALRAIGLHVAEDEEIFEAARRAGAVVMTKDSDFIDLLARHGPPPQIVWVTCGNTSNARMRAILERVLPDVLGLLQQGEHLVEISGA